MDYIKSMFKTKSQKKHNFSLPLKAVSGRNSAHSLPFDILEEIFLFVPYQYCQNIWIASSILQIPLAPKLKRLREYQEWVQVQIQQLKADYESQKTEIDKLKTDSESLRSEINKLKIDYESQKTEIDKLKTDILSQQAQTRIDEQQTEIDKLKIDYESQKTEINKLKTDIISQQTNIGEQQNQ
ncbi:hypothetical protein Ddc_11037 [Ditylenchus destructor]|nr:hypothetical protein Ddc_11037 [Ditylenchus destructor]